MRITTTLATLSAALLVAAPVASAAPAGPPTAPAPSPAATQPTPPDARALTALVEALRTDLGLTPEQFLAQATTGDRLARAGDDFAKTFAQAFGGVWLTDAGVGVVGVTPGDRGRELTSAARRAGFTVKDVALTADQLNARQRQVSTIVAGLPADLKPLVVGVRLDPTRNAVVAVTRGGRQDQIGTITARLKDLAIVEAVEAPSPAGDTAPFGSQGGTRGPGTPTAAGAGLSPAGQTATAPGATQPAATQPGAGGGTGSLSSESLTRLAGSAPDGPARALLGLLAGAAGATGSVTDGMNLQVPDPATPVRPEQRKIAQPAPAGPVVGGTAFDSTVSGGVLECSTGFNGTLDGKPVVITAAHCAGAEGTRAAFGDGTQFGTFTKVKKQDVDSAVIAVDSAMAQRFRNNLVGGAAGASQAITGTARPVVGQKACKSGARTGFSCGTVSQVDATIDVAGKRQVKGGFTVDLCALPGDSGGVVFTGDRALGISSASNVADAPDCARAEATARQAKYTPRLSVVPIDAVLAAQPGLKLA